MSGMSGMSGSRPQDQTQRSAQAIRSKAMPPRAPQGPLGPATLPVRQSRTTHACDRCRLMRTKCSGGEICSKCIKDHQPCVYGDGKREKNKKELLQSNQTIESLSEQNGFLLNALRNVTSTPRFQPGEYPEVVELLSKYSADGQFVEESFSSPQPGRDIAGELHASATVGSPGAQDELQDAVDLGQGTGAAGFMGKMSEVSWIQRAKEHLIRLPQGSGETIETLQIQYDHHTRNARQVNYFLDDMDLLSVDEDHVVAQDMPDVEVCFLLAEACFHGIQCAFMFVHRERFIEALVHFPRQKPILSWVERRWLALANLVFALGAKWLQQTESDPRNVVHNHLEFYARARALGLDHRVVYDHPVLEQIQALGLLAFYLFVNGSIFRSWTILGHALRHATALGLHLRVADSTISEIDRLRRARTWYSLYSLEVLVSETTGRPKSIAVADITTPIHILNAGPQSTAFSEYISGQYGAESQSRKLWQEFLGSHRTASLGMIDGRFPIQSHASRHQGLSPLHFTHRIHLCIISHHIGTALYSAAEDQTWADLQRRTSSLNLKLLRWRENLPRELSMDSVFAPDSDPRSRIELAMYYQSVRMILYRPCLCNIDIDNESASSKEFDLQSARNCVDAALAMLSLMPDSPVAQEVLQILPWWSLLHYVSQSAAVLFLELSLASIHYPDEVHLLVSGVKKAMLYLYRMTTGSRSAYKAWKVFRVLLTDAMVQYIDVDITDVPQDAARPANWDAAFERSLEGGVQALLSANTSPIHIDISDFRGN